MSLYAESLRCLTVKEESDRSLCRRPQYKMFSEKLRPKRYTKPPVNHLFLCGWHLESEIPLPELRPWDDPEAEVDIRIRIGAVPQYPNMEANTLRFTMQGSDDCRIQIPGIAVFGVKGGRELTVEPAISVESTQFRNYLFGSGLGLLCHQRGVLPFHGSCLQIGDQAVIFSGKSGAGKSTLAAALTHRGYRLLADDVCALTLRDGRWVVWPAFPRVKLKPAAHKAIFGQNPGLETLSLQGKHHFCFDPVKSFDVTPLPLGAIYFLEKAEDGELERIEEVKGLDRIALLQGQIFRRQWGLRMGRQIEFFKNSALIAGKVKIRRLFRSFDFTRMNNTMEILEDAHSIRAFSEIV